MEREKLESLLIDYIDEKLNDEDQARIEKELAVNENARQLYEQLKEVIAVMDKSAQLQPTANLKNNFTKFLDQQVNESRKAKTIFFQPAYYRVAAAIALLIIGGGTGFWISNQQKQHAELEAMRKEVAATKLMMMSMLDNQQSASQRVMGANVAYKMEQPDTEIVDALITAMNHDENTNVRLASLDALGKFHQQPKVRKALIKALASQQDPIVQIALIRLMVDMKEKEAVKEFQRITNDDEALPAVKDEAHVALFRLS